MYTPHVHPGADSSHQSSSHAADGRDDVAHSASTPPTSQRPGSPPWERGDRGHFRKKRKTLACYDCRRRKLKCDREFPACTRCVKSGHPETCLYEDTASDNGDAPSGDAARVPPAQAGHGHQHPYHSYVRPVSPAGRLHAGVMEQVAGTVAQQQATIAQLQNKISSLEAKVIGLHYQDFNNIKASKAEAIINEGLENGPHDPAKEAYHEMEPFHMRGKGYKTKFYGASDVQVLLPQFTELQEYIRDSIITNPKLQQIQNRAKQLRKSIKEGRARPTYSGKDLARLIPRREIADMLVQLYLNTFSMIYPIVHKPSFVQLYEKFWLDPSSVHEDFIAKLILAMSTVRCCIAHPSEHITFLGLTSSLKKQAQHWVGEVEAWLDSRSYKRVARSDFQVRCLRVMAKMTCMLKQKRSFMEAGTLLRWGMSAGLHRNGAVRSKTLSAFDFEMRQRIWAFMKIWDLQACIERGMPIWPGELADNDMPPLNLDDADLSKEAESLPSSKNRDDFTDASYLRLSMEMFALRSSITMVVNTARSYVDYSEVLTYDAKLTEKLHSLPKWTDSTTSDQERLRRALPQFLLETQLRQCQLMLHRPYMRIATTHPRYSYSRNVCLETAAAILDRLLALPPSIRDVAFMLGPDFYRATFTICQSLYVSSLVRSDTLFNATRESLSATILQVISITEEKVMRSGNGMDQHWLLQAAFFFMRTKKNPERLHDHVQAMVDRVVDVHDRIAKNQNLELADPVVGEPSVSGTAGTIDSINTPVWNDGRNNNLMLWDFLELPDLSPDMLQWNDVDIGNGVSNSLNGAAGVWGRADDAAALPK